ncbi:MAG: nucleotidyltransferase domain-containing protein [Bacteroidetes bacterium]|nr:nucleotidyltransferase domain-containing protein [Bacteroidota bacterium]
MLAPIITNNIATINALCKEYKVKELYVFGSAAKNLMKESSDVDFIVKFNTEVPVEDYADLYFDLVESLEDLLKRNVDLLTDKPIRNKYLKKDIEETKQII